MPWRNGRSPESEGVPIAVLLGNSHAHAFAVEVREIVADEPAQQSHQFTDFSRRPRPILGAERKNGEKVDSEIAGGARCTWFLTPANPVTARKKWIAGSLEPRGALWAAIDVYRRQGRFAAAVEPKLIELDSNRVNLELGRVEELRRLALRVDERVVVCVTRVRLGLDVRVHPAVAQRDPLSLWCV